MWLLCRSKVAKKKVTSSQKWRWQQICFDTFKKYVYPFPPHHKHGTSKTAMRNNLKGISFCGYKFVCEILCLRNKFYTLIAKTNNRKYIIRSEAKVIQTFFIFFLSSDWLLKVLHSVFGHFSHSSTLVKWSICTYVRSLWWNWMFE